MGSETSHAESLATGSSNPRRQPTVTETGGPRDDQPDRWIHGQRFAWTKDRIHCKGHAIVDYRYKNNKSASSEQLGSNDRERDQ
ncbi:MAG: hypothetical protein Fues2KO_54290 [Fuerstiella sp.]